MPHSTIVNLSQSQIEFFNKNGYIALPNITSPEEMETLRTAYDRIFANRAGRENGDQFDLAGSDNDDEKPDLPQILNPRKYAPEFRNTLYEANCLAIAKQLLGQDAELKGEHAILKPPMTGVPTPWHQDEAYWDPKYRHTSISFWMPLQEATVENGCMQFIPWKSADETKIVPHQSIGGNPHVHGLEVLDVNEINLDEAVQCPIPAGGVTIHDSKTLHYTGPNLSDKPRRAYILSFALPFVLHEDHEHIEEFPWNANKHTARSIRAAKAGVTRNAMGELAVLSSN